MIAEVAAADHLAGASISWFEIAWLAENERTLVNVPTHRWLAPLTDLVLTVVISPQVAANTAAPSSSFPGGPADRLIYASAFERVWTQLTKDRRMRDCPWPRSITLWWR